tara:strand:+ start:16530 stop:17405 length:876 start_codon:yes stop_codon:yes gene_type:complete
MSISGQNLTIVIVTLKSQNIIDECIKSINQNVPIIVVENSKDQSFKNRLESKYSNLKCVLSNSNLGMGAGNNIGIKSAKTDYVFVLNPDVKLESNTLNEIYSASKKIQEFSIISPISSDKNFPNYGLINKIQDFKKTELPFKVDYVDGFAMILNKKKFKNNNYFDENFFLYLENNDLCLRVNKEGGSIFVVPTAKINHKGGKAVDSKYKNEIEFSRNWHWLWSKFYYNKKNYGITKAIKENLSTFVSSIFKFIFYFIINNRNKKKIYFNRASGFYNALIGKSAWYRPNLED